LGLRAQALSSFRDCIRLMPSQTESVLTELDQQRFSSTDLATLALGDAQQMLQVARHLLQRGEPAAVEVEMLVAQAATKGAPREEQLLVLADLEVARGRLAEATKAFEEGRRLSPQDARFDAGLSVIAEREGHLSEALAAATAATTLSPFSVPLARRRVSLVLRLQRWSDLDDALSRLKIALRQSGQNVTEVHMLAGDTFASRANLARALSEYRTAATLDPKNPATWAAVGRISEARGDLSGAAAAYRQQAALGSADPGAQQAVRRIEKARTEARLKEMLP
jgi:Flp pilus assembly protein TadD